MSFGGFGKSSGPSAPPRAQTPFGHFPRPPSPSPPRSPDFPSSNKRPAVPYLPQSPPVVFQNNINVGSQHPASEVQQSSDFPSSNKGYMVPYRPGSPPVGFQNNINIGGISPANEVQQRPLSSPVWGNQPKTYIQNSVRPAQESNSSVSRGGGTYQSGFIFHTKPMDVPLQKRSRSPVFLSTRGASPENSVFPSEGHRRSLIDYTDLDAPEALSSPPLSFKRSVSSAHAPRPFPGTQKSFSSPSWVNQLNSSNNANPPVQEDTSPVVTTRETYQLGRTLQTGRAEGPLPKRTRSPTLPSTVGAFSQNSVSASDGLKRAPDSHSHRETKHNGVEVARDNPMHIKRTKLQLQSSTDQVFHENVDSSQETERELHAKAKRLARFKDELSQPMQGHSTVRSQKVPAKMPQPLSEKQKFSEDPRMDVTRNSAGANVFQDHEGVASSSSIVGLCPDMCPESERTERGRKGDLDQYERVDGDRNLTSEVLAVKKYNRTAEREADLIRPMPILQKTMDYLLNLLDQPYDDRFLGLYNFLWDRMRAIRMDLRMQHIFNLEAISMLEQMIRLHIIAMHEFCEYTKGEGFSEGFDGHLNIEQMNKTSVELFQLYDDHRKKGRHVPSEREFRGYYALLKLDKHPGYKVEPAELSLDLAKMTPEVRQTPEVLFARDVARACRTGNFIAFFRLARKATYLQACLMHAHFSKLRTLALGSLHSGLQVNQGIPVAQVAKWLGMEEEDIETLLEHHGFSVKDFEEPYMVKENAFINADEDFPVKRSQLVMRKRSMMIVSDVSFPSLSELHTTKEVKEFQLQKDPELTPKPAKALGPLDNVHPPHVEARDLPTISSPKGSIQKPMHEISTDVVTPHEKMTRPEIQLAPVSPLILDSSISSSNQSRVESATRSLYDPVFRNSFGRKIKHGVEETIPIPLEMAEEEGGHILPLDSVVDTPIPELMLSEDLENQELVGTMEEDQFDEVTTSYYDKEVAEGKLKLILRLWKRRAAKKRGWRENKQIAASAALNLLSVGPPIWQYEIQSGNYDMFNIDHVMSERHEIQEKSWSLLNPSDVVAATLADKNRDAKCLCWKLLLCSQATSAACSWLHSKFMPTENDSDDNLLVSSPDLAIWRSWIPSQSGVDTCCLSIIKSATFNELNKSVSGVSAILFLLAEHIPMQIQKKQLHDLVVLLPCGSHLPLLILSGSSKDDSDPSTIAKELGLQDIDKSRVSISYIVFLKDKEIKKLDGFFSSERLIEGLEWLASESPPQIIVSKMKARGLVQSHLNPTLEVLGEHGIGPNHCISVFNEALDRSMKEISAAANSNPTGWPCPEIDLLDKYSDEYRAIAWNLPSTGWSLASRIESLICSLNNLKLPTFDDDLSWLSKGLDIGVDIEFQKSRLENCLTNYLTNTCQMIGVAFARKEANIMLQKCTRLELHNATYHIVPKWVHIFRRICSWLLMNLTSGEVSSTYVLVQNHIAAPEDKPEPEFSTSPCPYIVEPSLDELFEVSCHELGPSGMESGVYERLLPMPMDVARLQTSNDDVTLMESESETAQDSISTSYVDSLTEVKNDGVRMMPTKKATKEADRISELLEKCNLMQNLIDKKLSIYF